MLNTYMQTCAPCFTHTEAYLHAWLTQMYKSRGCGREGRERERGREGARGSEREGDREGDREKEGERGRKRKVMSHRYEPVIDPVYCILYTCAHAHVHATNFGQAAWV